MIDYKKLTDEDYDDIIDISKDIWDGYDYLPSVFHKWVDDKGFFVGAVDSERNKVVGVGKYTILTDGTGWLEGLRVHKDYRGLKIARGISQYLLNLARSEMDNGNIKKIAFGTHVSNIESIGLMSKMNFKLKKELIIVSKAYNKADPALSLCDFNVNAWDIGYDEFVRLPYFKRRNNILPIGYTFQEPTLELYNEFKRNNSLISVNGFKGIFLIKGEPYFECIDDSFEGINTFMDYLLLNLKGITPCYPVTTASPDDYELIEKLKSNDYEAWTDWKPDYLYYVYE